MLFYRHYSSQAMCVCYHLKQYMRSLHIPICRSGGYSSQTWRQHRENNDHWRVCYSWNQGEVSVPKMWFWGVNKAKIYSRINLIIYYIIYKIHHKFFNPPPGSESSLQPSPHCDWGGGAGPLAECPPEPRPERLQHGGPQVQGAGQPSQQ